MYYDRDGSPLTLLEWNEKFALEANRRVASDGIGDILVSTVWLGLDHNMFFGPPLIFETMIFGGEHDGFQERYVNEEEALTGHVRALEVVQEACCEPDYSYDLGRYVHAQGCRHGDADTRYLKEARTWN